MDTRFEVTLKRQLKKMAGVVRRSEPDQNADLKLAYHVDELAQFAKQLSLQPVAHQRVGKGGILVGCSPLRGQSLSSRIYSKVSQSSVVRQLRRIGAPVSAICDPALPDNSIFAAELDLGVQLGIPRLFWFPCDLDFLKKIYFMRVIVVTVYNPAHLLNALRERGYEIRVEYQKTGPPKFEISKKLLKGIAEVQGFDFFLRLVQHRFMREAKIMEGFEAVLDRVPEPVSGQSVRFGLSFVHHC